LFKKKTFTRRQAKRDREVRDRARPGRSKSPAMSVIIFSEDGNNVTIKRQTVSKCKSKTQPYAL
jgi:hypothetical protein